MFFLLIFRLLVHYVLSKYIYNNFFIILTKKPIYFSRKEALETNLYEAQNTISQLQVKKEQLEGENQELLLRKEQLQGEIQRLHAELNVEIEKSARQRDQLHQRLTQVERDKDLLIQQHHQVHEDDIERMTREREKLRHELEAAREETIRHLSRDKDETVQRYEKEKEDLHYELANVITERDQALIEAENEKQKVRNLFDQKPHLSDFV